MRYSTSMQSLTPHAGEIIQAHRRNSGLTQAQAAEQMGISQPRWSYMESRASISTALIPAVAGVLGVPVRALALELLGLQ